MYGYHGRLHVNPILGNTQLMAPATPIFTSPKVKIYVQELLSDYKLSINL